MTFGRAPALRLIRQLPFGRRTMLRVYNRLLMHLAPVRTRQTYFGAAMTCDVRDMIQGTITHFGIWEPAISRLFEEIIRPGSVAVDVGANVGYYSMLMAKCVGPAGSVVAVEALPKLADRIGKHLADNGISNVRLVNAAVSDRDGQLMVFEAPGTNIGMSTLRRESGFPAAASVSGRPLLDILTPDEIANASLIKIDIEGAEIPPVLEILGALDRFPAHLAIVVEADASKNPEWPDLLDRFTAAGFAAWQLPNSYDWIDLLDEKLASPKRLMNTPAGLSDLLFVRPEFRPASLS